MLALESKNYRKKLFFSSKISIVFFIRLYYGVLELAESNGYKIGKIWTLGGSIGQKLPLRI